MSFPVRVRIPERVAAGDEVRVRALAQHPMETGFRVDTRGERRARHIITRFQCRYDDRLIVDMELRPGIAADPYLEFAFIADRSGEVVLHWEDDRGEVAEHRSVLKVQS